MSISPFNSFGKRMNGILRTSVCVKSLWSLPVNLAKLEQAWRFTFWLHNGCSTVMNCTNCAVHIYTENYHLTHVLTKWRTCPYSTLNLLSQYAQVCVGVNFLLARRSLSRTNRSRPFNMLCDWTSLFFSPRLSKSAYWLLCNYEMNVL